MYTGGSIVDFKELDKQEREQWGVTSRGFCEEVRPGLEKVTIFIKQVGRRFVNGRAVYMFYDKTILGDDYFLPAGNYGGRVLK